MKRAVEQREQKGKLTERSLGESQQLFRAASTFAACQPVPIRFCLHKNSIALHNAASLLNIIY